MDDIKNFQKIISDLSKEFGKQMEDLSLYLPGEDKTEKRTQLRFKSSASKWKHQRILQDGNAVYKSINKDLLQECLRRHIEATGYDFAISNFTYQGAKMDILGLINNRAIEFSIKTDLQQFASEFTAVYRLGPKGVNKQTALENGKGLPNFFYFIVPAGMLKPANVPGHCGLIESDIIPGCIMPSFSILRTAPMLHNSFVPGSTYKIIAQKIDQHRQALIHRYQRNIFSAINPERPAASTSIFD